MCLTADHDPALYGRDGARRVLTLCLTNQCNRSLEGWTAAPSE